MAESAFPFDAQHVVDFHEACLDFGKWPGEEAPAHPPGDIWPWVEANHAANAQLAGSAHSAADLEAQRNEALERLDATIHAALSHCIRPGARLHATTPAALIDRLSKLALQIRAAAPAAGLEAQRRGLVASLAALLGECAAGSARFR